LHEAETREQFKWALLDWTKNSHHTFGSWRISSRHWPRRNRTGRAL